MTLDGAPYIGNYSALTPSMYAATGFNKWGMTSSMLAAQILADLVCGRKKPLCGRFFAVENNSPYADGSEFCTRGVGACRHIRKEMPAYGLQAEKKQG